MVPSTTSPAAAGGVVCQPQGWPERGLYVRTKCGSCPKGTTQIPTARITSWKGTTCFPWIVRQRGTIVASVHLEIQVSDTNANHLFILSKTTQ